MNNPLQTLSAKETFVLSTPLLSISRPLSINTEPILSTEEQHLKLIRDRGDFSVDCSHSIFSTEELELLKCFGHWFAALESGELKPITELQNALLRSQTKRKRHFLLKKKLGLNTKDENELRTKILKAYKSNIGLEMNFSQEKITIKCTLVKNVKSNGISRC